LLEGDVGEYQLAPGFVIEVTREGNQLFIQATGQSKLPILPESEPDFFLKVVDAGFEGTPATPGVDRVGASGGTSRATVPARVRSARNLRPGGVRAAVHACRMHRAGAVARARRCVQRR